MTMNVACFPLCKRSSSCRCVTYVADFTYTPFMVLWLSVSVHLFVFSSRSMDHLKDLILQCGWLVYYSNFDSTCCRCSWGRFDRSTVFISKTTSQYNITTLPPPLRCILFYRFFWRKFIYYGYEMFAHTRLS